MLSSLAWGARQPRPDTDFPYYEKRNVDTTTIYTLLTLQVLNDTETDSSKQENCIYQYSTQVFLMLKYRLALDGPSVEDSCYGY